MKTQPFASGRHVPSASAALAGITLLLGAAAPAQDPGGGIIIDPPILEGHHVSLQVADIAEPGGAGHRLVVTYAGFPEVARRSFGDGDVWVAKPGGYNELAALVEVRELPVLFPQPGDPIDPVIGGVAGEEIDPNNPRWFWPFGPAYQVTYRIPAPRPDGWSAEDNGGYSVLLARGEVLDVEGTPLAPRLLGDFDVRIGGVGGEPVPVFPDEVGIGFREFPAPGLPGGPVLTAVFADVKVAYRESDVRVEWGEVRREGNTFTGHLRAVSSGDDEIGGGADGESGSRFEHSFDLGVLEGGDYRFVLMSNGRMVGGAPFVLEGGGGGDPVPAIPDAAHVRVSQLPAIQIFPPPPTQWGALVELVFDDPVGVEVVDWGEVRRDGEPFFVVDVTAVRRPVAHPEPGPDGLLPPDGNGGLRHEFVLGALKPGVYGFLVTSRGEPVGRTSFTIPGDGGGGEVPDAEVGLDVDAGGPEVVVHAHVHFNEEQWAIADAGAPRRDGNLFVIDATARRWPIRFPNGHGDPNADGVVDPILPPPPPDAELTYSLGPLPRGEFGVLFRMNGESFARTSFVVAGDGGGPPTEPPMVHGIEVAKTGDGGFAATVGVVLALPGIEVLDWGEVRREANRFHVEIVVGVPPEPVEAAEGEPLRLPGVPGDFPIRLVRHTYPLGMLERGVYSFAVTHEGEPVAVERFEVDGGGEENPPPTVDVEVADVVAPGGQPHPFTVRFHDRSGLDLDSIRDAGIWVVTPAGDRLPAEQLSFAHTEDLPPSGAFAEYQVAPPGGSWDARDRGRYRLFVEREAVRDLQGNVLREGAIGRFSVEIWPEPEPPRFPAEIEVAPGEDGLWSATVGLGVPVDLAARDDWEVQWGRLEHRGSVFVASVRFVRAGAEGDDANGGALLPPPIDPGGDPAGITFLRHAWELGALRPGDHTFLVMSNLGHFARAGFVVPGGDGAMDDPDEPFERWVAMAFEAGDWLIHPERTREMANADGGLLANLFEYVAGTDPEDPADDAEGLVRPVIVPGPDGERHLGLRFRRILAGSDLRFRFEASIDLHRWVDVTTEVDLMEQEPSIDGVEEVLACLRESIGESPYRFVRLVVDRVTAGDGM